MFYIKSRFYRYPLRKDRFYGDAIDNLIKKNPRVGWVEEAVEIPPVSANADTLLWNPCTALHCFVNSEELKTIDLLKKGLSIEEIKSKSSVISGSLNKDFIKQLFLRTMITLDRETFIPLDIYKEGPVFEERYLIELLLSESCQLTCKYCFAEPNKKRPPMTRETASAAIDKAMQLPVSSFTLEFGGGETFLYFKEFANLVKEIKEKADRAEKDVHIVVQTNGTLLHKHKMVEFLLKNNINVGFSMDGPPEINDLSRPYSNGKGSAKDILKSMKLMHHFGKKKIPFLTVVNRYNVDYPEQVVDYFNSLGSSRGMFLPTLKLGAAETAWDEIGLDADEYFDFMKRMLEHSVYGKNFQCLMIKRMLDNLINPTRDFRCMRSLCGAGKDYIVVDSRGDIFPCSHHVHREELKMGSITDSTPLSHYFPRNQLLEEVFDTRRINNISTCSRCIWRHLCEGGCSLDSFYHHGHMQGSSTLCGYYRKIYPFLLQCCVQHSDIITAYLEDEVEIISF